jgi:hypothetical protein
MTDDKKTPRSDASVRKAREREERANRLAAALRANLAKRKAQQRTRAAKKPEE